jgi:hypothetical protein
LEVNDSAKAPHPGDFHELQAICTYCQHPIGYHYREGDKCSCKDYACPGYEGYPHPKNSN